MERIIAIQNSDEVMAMFRELGNYYPGKIEYVKITGITQNKSVPLEVRTALVGLTIPTIFTKESIERHTGESFQIPDGSRFAYCTDIAECLKSNGKLKEADLLTKKVKNILDMYIIEPSACELSDKTSQGYNFSIGDFIGGNHPFKKGGSTHPHRKD